MIWNRSLHALIPRNPIIERELRYQQRTRSFRSGFIETVGVVIVALCIATAMLFCVVYGLTPRGNENYLISIQILAWAFHIIAVVRFLSVGVFNSAKDRCLLNSDDLMLTPLSNWQLLFGKWWSTIHQIRGWMLAFGIVQLGLVVSTAFGLLMSFSWYMTCLNPPCVVTLYSPSQIPWFTPTRSLFIVASTIGITFLETVCCTVLGMAISLLVRSKFDLFYAFFLRFLPVFIFSFYPDYPWGFSNEITLRYREYTWFSFADGGTSAILQLAHGIASFDRGLLALFSITGMLLLYSSFSFVTAWSVMKRSRY